MIRYLEIKGLERKNLIRLDAIKRIEEHTTPGSCLINGERFDIGYDEIKKIIESDDSRVAIDYDWHPLLVWMSRNRIVDYIKEFGEEKTVEFLKELVLCDTETECIGLYGKYRVNQDG